MFSGAIIGLFAGLSAMAWVYSKMMRRTGGNNKSSLVTGLVFGAITWVVVATIVGMIDSSLGN